MKILSAKTLFHFTKEINFLESIIQNGFYPRYCNECFSITETTIDLWIPMICFCDIPLSQIKNHIETYGSYGIGMSKDWANKNGLNPVLYIRKNSFIAKKLKIIQNSIRDNRSSNPIPAESFLELLRNIKPYEGEFLKGGNTGKNIVFYDEREWRHTPDYKKNIPFALTKMETQDNNVLEEANIKAMGHNLTFEPDDIKYIIVKEVIEIPKIVSALRKKFNFRNDEKEMVLVSKIITCEQILNDF